MEFKTEIDRLRQQLEEGDVDGMRADMRRSTARRALFDKK